MLDTNDHQTIRDIVREETTDLRTELRRTTLLMEDMDSTIATILELLVINLDVKAQVEDHEPRIARLESASKIYGGTLRDHTRQLKSR